MRNSWRPVKFEEVIKANQKSKIQVKDAFDSEQYPFFTSGEKILKHPNFLVDKENIFMSTGGVAQVKYFRGRSSYSTDTFSFSCNNNFNVKFIYYLILSKINEIDYKFFIGSGLKHLQKELLNNNYYKIPTLTQQKKIAKILTTCDEVIEKTEAAIAKYQALKQGMMHDLFTRGIDIETGKLRPSYQDEPELYKECELDMIPKEWEMGHFIDFADERISHSFTGGPFGSDLQTRDYTKEGVRIIQLQNIGDGKFNNGYKIYTSEEKANYLRACNIYPGEIILSKMAEPIARACIIPIDNERYLMASDGIRLSIDKKRFNLKFVLETINQKRFRSIAEIRSTGTTRSRIGLTELKGIPVCYPQKNEQDIIGIKLDNLEESIEIEQSALSKYQQLKAGLMQDLLTGKVEVREESKKIAC